MVGHEPGQPRRLDPIQPGDAAVRGGAVPALVEVLTRPDHRHVGVEGAKHAERLSELGGALERCVQAEEHDPDRFIGPRLRLAEPACRSSDRNDDAVASCRFRKQLEVLRRVHDGDSCRGHRLPIEAAHQPMPQPGDGAAIGRRVCKRHEMVQHDRRVAPEPTGEVNVKVAHVADEHDVGARQPSAATPQLPPRPGQPGDEERSQPGAP